MAKFTPKYPLTMQKEDQAVNKDSRFISGLISEQIRIGGVVVYAWLMRSLVPQVSDDGYPMTALDESIPGIQDVILGENRDRIYEDDCVRLVGAYQAGMNALDYARFGIMISDDIVQMEFHWEDMEQQCGRRLQPGDVVEMPHLRMVGSDGRPMVRWYEVKSIVRSPTSWDHTYHYHVVTVTMRPMKDAQEFADLMDRETETGNTLGDDTSSGGAMMDMTAQIQKAATEQAYTTWWDTTPVYIDPDTTLAYRWTADSKPPNGIPAAQVSAFPASPADGDYALRVDMAPNRLYRFQAGKWILKEIDIKREWNTYNWVSKLRQFASDGSAADDARPWELKSIHDVGTPRQKRSDPSPKGDGTYVPPAKVDPWEDLES